MIRGMLKPLLTIGLACLALGCQGLPPPSALENQNESLHGIIRSQEKRINELTQQRDELEQKVDTLAAKTERGEDTGGGVERANSDVSAHVARMIERFKSDAGVEIEETEDGFRFLLNEKILFGSASAELTDEGKQALQRVADALRGGVSHLIIEGHTDDVKIVKKETLAKYPRGNIDLAAARALAVWAQLVNDGTLDPARVAVAAYGPHRPLVPNDSPLNRHRNRRVEIRVSDVR